MGAHDYICTYKEADESKVRKLWEEQVEDDRCESGGGSYAGNATTMHGKVRFRDKRLASETEAHDWLLEHHEKWEAPLACSFYLPEEKGKREQSAVAKAEAKQVTVEEARLEVAQKIQAAFVERKSKLVACKGCGSRLSQEHLTRGWRKGNLQFNQRGDVKTFAFASLPSLPACPLCKADLLSESDQKRLATHAAKCEAAKQAVVEANKPKPGKKIGWCVGGWAAS